MSHTFYFTDFRDVKRTVNTIDQALSRPIGKLSRRINSDTPLGKFLDEAKLTIDDLDIALPKEFTDVSDFYGIDKWIGAQLCCLQDLHIL